MFENLNFEILKEKLELLRQEGKSTFVDMIIGLVKPVYGSLEVDGKYFDGHLSTSGLEKISICSSREIFLITVATIAEYCIW